MANTIKVSVLGDVKDINRKLGNVEQQLGGFGKKISGVGKALVGAFAAAGVVNGIKSVVTSASDLNETVSKTQTIFGKSSPAILAWANGAAKSLGMSKQAALDGVSTFGNFFNQIGIGTKQSEKMSKAFVQAATDLGSFHNAAPVEVMDALSAATRGEYDSLQKYIPTINAAKVEQEALAATHKKSAKELTDQDKAMAVHSLVMKGQGKAAGDFARTQGSLANQQKILNAQMENAKATIGTYLLPLFTKIATYINTNVIPTVKTFAQNIAADLGPKIQAFGQFLSGTVVPALASFGGWLQQNQAWLKPIAAGIVAIVAAIQIWSAVTKAYIAIQAALNLVMSLNPIGIVILAIIGLVAAIVYAWKNSETFRNVVIGAWNAIKSAASNVFGWLKTFISGAFNFIKTAFTKYTPLGIILSHFGQIKSFVTGAINGVKGAWSTAWNAMKSLVNSVWAGIKSGVTTGINTVISLVKGIHSKVVGALSGAGSWLIGIGSQMMQGLKNGISNAWGSVMSLVRSLIDRIPAVVRKALGIHSPSRVFRDFGKNIGQGLVIGLDGMGNKVSRAAGGMASAVANGFEAPRLSLNAAATAGGGGVGNTYQIKVLAIDPQSASRGVIDAIKEHERLNGSGWRR